MKSERDEQLCSPLFFLQLSPSRFVDLDDTMVIAPAIENHAHSDVDRFFLCPNCIWRRRGHKWSRLWSYRPLKGSLKAVLLHRVRQMDRRNDTALLNRKCDHCLRSSVCVHYVSAHPEGVNNIINRESLCDSHVQ